MTSFGVSSGYDTDAEMPMCRTDASFASVP